MKRNLQFVENHGVVSCALAAHDSCQLVSSSRTAQARWLAAGPPHPDPRTRPVLADATRLQPRRESGRSAAPTPYPNEPYHCAPATRKLRMQKSVANATTVRTVRRGRTTAGQSTRRHPTQRAAHAQAAYAPCRRETCSRAPSRLAQEQLHMRLLPAAAESVLDTATSRVARFFFPSIVRWLAKTNPAAMSRSRNPDAMMATDLELQDHPLSLRCAQQAANTAQ